MAQVPPKSNPTVVLGIENNNLTCTPAVLHVTRNANIEFSSQMGEAFAIQAKGVSPLVKADIRSVPSSPIDPSSPKARASVAPISVHRPITVAVRADVEPGVYSFACALYANEQIYMDAACPAVIVDW